MKQNTTQISGVLKQQNSQEHYQLRRFFPRAELADWIEQFWLVDWDLGTSNSHTQRNLPDPNFHLVITDGRVTITGPVSKVYAYTMEKKGRIIGVKFCLGGLNALLPFPVERYVDTEIPAQDILGNDVCTALMSALSQSSDSNVVAILEQYLSPFVTSQSDQHSLAQELVAWIKQNEDVVRLEQVASYAGLSQRTVQRLFKDCIGLSPKWLIRKYRLHHAIAALDNQQTSILDIVERLGYTDQSHLINDFKSLLDVTPQAYQKE